MSLLLVFQTKLLELDREAPPMVVALLSKKTRRVNQGERPLHWDGLGLDKRIQPLPLRPYLAEVF
jgi:hypothetical protein